MNRFDRNFNDSDPESGRPFTRGYPDGVWIMGMIICLFLAGTLIGTILGSVNALKESGSISAIVGTLFAGILVSMMWVTFLVLLKKRSVGVIPFSVMLAFIALAGGAFAGKASGNGIVGPLVVFAIFIYFALYTEGLRKDGIVGKETKLNKSVVTTPEATPPAS